MESKSTEDDHFVLRFLGSSAEKITEILEKLSPEDRKNTYDVFNNFFPRACYLAKNNKMDFSQLVTLYSILDMQKEQDFMERYKKKAERENLLLGVLQELRKELGPEDFLELIRSLRPVSSALFEAFYYKFFPINQTAILNKFRKYLDIQLKKGDARYQNTEVQNLMKQMETGHCSGFSGLYLIRKSKQEESQFFGYLQLIAAWDETSTTLDKSPYLQSVFEQMMNDLIILQRKDELRNFETHQRGLVDLYEPIKPTARFDNAPWKADTKNRQETKEVKERKDPKSERQTASLSNEFSLTFIFNDKDLEGVFNKILNKGKMLRLDSMKHTIAVFVDPTINSLFWLYDPNEDKEVPCFSLFSLINKIKQCLFQNLNIRLASNFFSPTTDVFPLLVDVFEWQNNKPGKYDKSEILHELLSGTGAENRATMEKYTQFYFALIYGDLETLDALLAVDPEMLDVMVTNAVYTNDPKRFENSPSGIRSRYINLLQTAIWFGNVDIVAYLCQKGADVNAVNSEGWSALHYAADLGNTTIINLLLERGANVQLKDAEGNTPLDIAKIRGRQKAEDILLERVMKERVQSSAVKKTIGNEQILYSKELKDSKENKNRIEPKTKEPEIKETKPKNEPK